MVLDTRWHFTTLYDTLLQNATDIVTKCDSYFITKCDKNLLQNWSGFFTTKCDSFITKCYKMRQLLHNATFITNCDSTQFNKDLTKLLEILQKKCQIAIELFRDNVMIVHPFKFQWMIIDSKKNLSCKPILKTNGAEIIPGSSVSLLDIEINNKLDFDKHVSN